MLTSPKIKSLCSALFSVLLRTRLKKSVPVLQIRFKKKWFKKFTRMRLIATVRHIYTSTLNMHRALRDNVSILVYIDCQQIKTENII